MMTTTRKTAVTVTLMIPDMKYILLILQLLMCNWWNMRASPLPSVLCWECWDMLRYVEICWDLTWFEEISWNLNICAVQSPVPCAKFEQPRSGKFGAHQMWGMKMQVTRTAWCCKVMLCRSVAGHGHLSRNTSRNTSQTRRNQTKPEWHVWNCRS